MSGLLREPHVLSSAALNTVSTTKRTATIFTHTPGSISAFRPSLAPIPFVRSRAAHRYFAVARSSRGGAGGGGGAARGRGPPGARGGGGAGGGGERARERT